MQLRKVLFSSVKLASKTKKNICLACRLYEVISVFFLQRVRVQKSELIKSIGGVPKLYAKT